MGKNGKNMEQVFSSDCCASVTVSGKSWKQIVRRALALLEQELHADHNYRLGFLYVTPALAAEAENIIELLGSVTRIERWTGAVGAGICGMDRAVLNQPALSLMLLAGEKDENILTWESGPAGSLSYPRSLEEWLDENEPLFCLTHAIGADAGELQAALPELSKRIGAYLVGGQYALPSSVAFSDKPTTAALSGVIFPQSRAVASALTQGCLPLGPVHKITRCDDNIIRELDGQRAYDVLATSLLSQTEGADSAPIQDKTDLLAGDNILAALPVPGSDQTGYFVKAITDTDPQSGTITLDYCPGHGAPLLFARRNAQTIQSDLSRMLLSLRKRAASEYNFTPSGALWISTLSRFVPAGQQEGAGEKAVTGITDAVNDAMNDEMALIREVLGDIPLTGFYSQNVISNSRLYDQGGVLVLFL